MTKKELASSKLPAITTRYAMREDLAEVLDMYITALHEIKEYLEPIAEEKCAQVVLKNWIAAPCILVEVNGEIVGFAGMRSCIPEYSNENILSEYMFYIKPEHRSVKAAKALSDAAKSAAKECGVNLYMSHFIKTSDDKTKVKFLKRWGYDPISIGVKYEWR